MSKILVVFGATGNQGGSVISHVLRDPELSKTYRIRAVTRNPSSSAAKLLASRGCEIVSGDPQDTSSLTGIFHGAHTVYAMTTSSYDGDAHSEIQRGKVMVDTAIAEGVQYYIWSTLPSPTRVSGGKYKAVVGFDDKAAVEDYLRSKTEIKSAFYAPGSFMQNYLTMMKPHPSHNNDGTYMIARPVAPDAAIPLVDIAGDTGKFVCAILASPDAFVGKTVYGASGMYTMQQQAEILSKATNKTVNYVQIPVDMYKGFLPEAMKDEITEMLLYQEEYGYYGSDTAAFVEWSVEHARGTPISLEDFLAANPLKLD